MSSALAIVYTARNSRNCGSYDGPRKANGAVRAPVLISVQLEAGAGPRLGPANQQLPPNAPLSEVAGYREITRRGAELGRVLPVWQTARARRRYGFPNHRRTVGISPEPSVCHAERLRPPGGLVGHGRQTPRASASGNRADQEQRRNQQRQEGSSNQPAVSLHRVVNPRSPAPWRIEQSS